MCTNNTLLDLRLEQISNCQPYHPTSCYVSEDKTNLLCRSHFEFSNCIKYNGNKHSVFPADNRSRSSIYFNDKSHRFGSLQVNCWDTWTWNARCKQIALLMIYSTLPMTKDSISKCSQLITLLDDLFLKSLPTLWKQLLRFSFYSTNRTFKFLFSLVLPYWKLKLQSMAAA